MCLATEDAYIPSQGSTQDSTVFAFPPLSPPTSYITINRRVCRATREGKLELGSWLGLGGLCVSVWLGLGGYELSDDSFLILLFHFVDLLIYYYCYYFFSLTEKS